MRELSKRGLSVGKLSFGKKPVSILGWFSEGHFPDGILPEGDFPDRQFPRWTVPQTEISPIKNSPDDIKDSAISCEKGRETASSVCKSEMFLLISNNFSNKSEQSNGYDSNISLES